MVLRLNSHQVAYMYMYLGQKKTCSNLRYYVSSPIHFWFKKNSVYKLQVMIVPQSNPLGRFCGKGGRIVRISGSKMLCSDSKECGLLVYSCAR